mgnify:CR=1 FL=1
MRKKSKKSSKNLNKSERVILATAILKLIEVIIELIKSFYE